MAMHKSRACPARTKQSPLHAPYLVLLIIDADGVPIDDMSSAFKGLSACRGQVLFVQATQSLKLLPLLADELLPVQSWLLRDVPPAATPYGVT